MSDLFHEDVPDSFIRDVFDVMARADHHLFQVLTKREDRLRGLAPTLTWPPNVWMGVTIENRRFVHRADALREVPAAVRFISAEPLLGPLERLDLHGIDWVIAGGESGHGARPMRVGWVRQLRDQCAQEEVSFFLKQLGGFPNKRGADQALLDGRLWRQMPEPARRTGSSRGSWTFA